MFRQVSSPFLYKYLFQKANQNKRSKVIWATFYKKYKMFRSKKISIMDCVFVTNSPISIMKNHMSITKYNTQTLLIV